MDEKTEASIKRFLPVDAGADVSLSDSPEFVRRAHWQRPAEAL